MTPLGPTMRLIALVLALAAVLLILVWLSAGPPPPDTQEMNEAMPALQAK